LAEQSVFERERFAFSRCNTIGVWTSPLLQGANSSITLQRKTPMHLKQQKILSCSLFALLVSCGSQESPNSLKEAWDQPNRPERFAGNYEFNLDKLPTQGESGTARWSGDYWASYKGGLAHRWNAGGDLSQTAAYILPQREALRSMDLKSLSPAEKYDIYSGDYSFSLTRLERARTRVLATIPGTAEFVPGFSIPSWEGLCHGWAPASISYQEPQPITLKNKDGLEVPFGSADVKALLTYAMHEGVGSQTVFLGRRCEIDLGRLKRDLREGRISRAVYEEQVQSLPCRDLNAGSFHVVLSNELGQRKQAFVADITVDQEVWNQGIVGYESRLGPVKPQRSMGAAAETAFEVDVETRITYITEVASSWHAQGSSGIHASAQYRYRLELNQNREIVGGQWLDETHPDFIYRQTRPLVSKRLEQLPVIYKASTQDEFFSNSTDPLPPSQPTVPATQPGSGSSSECEAGNPWCLG
jgi:hypothetical protein